MASGRGAATDQSLCYHTQEAVLCASDARAVPCFELSRMHTQPQFNAAAFMRQLGTAQLGQTLLTAAHLPSTQTLLQSNAQRFPDGTVCVADVQSGGKGGWPAVCLCFMQVDITRSPVSPALLAS